MTIQTKPIANVTVKKGQTMKSTSKSVTPSPPTNASFVLNNLGGCTVSVTVLIDANNTKIPTLNVDSDMTDFYVQYDYKEEIPAEVTEWTLSVDNYVGGLVAGQQVTVYLQDIDPKTSRGISVNVIRP